MSKPSLYNFHAYGVPEDIETLLTLLGFWSFWDANEKTHRIYELDIVRPRMRWKVQHFAGGTTEQWQAFLSKITGPEYVR